MPAELTMGTRIDMRLERDDEARLTRARFACPCGWVHRFAGKRLVGVPGAVKDHERVRPFARHDQLRLEDLGGAR